MPTDRTLAENLGRELTAIYGGTAERLAAATALQLDVDLDHIEDDNWSSRRHRALRQLEDQSRTLVARLGTEAAEAVEQMTVLAAQRGSAEALRELQRLGFALPADAAEVRRVLPGAEAAQRLAFSLTSTLQGTHLRITRWPLDVYREVTSRASSDILLGVATRRRAAQRVWEDFVIRGVTGFVDRSGRAWALESYVDMASRTVAAQAATEAHLDRLHDAGVDLVIVSDAPQECPLCREWEGRVLARRGAGARTEQHEHATRDGEMLAVDIAGSVDEAIGAGLMHPNCRHSLSAYFPGVTTVPRHTADPDGDAARQELRRLEREVRRQKLVAETALTPEARRAALARVRGLQGRIRGHVNATGLHRQRYREQLRLGHTPPPGSAPLPPASPPPPPTPPARTSGDLLRGADLRRMSDDQLDDLFGDLSAVDPDGLDPADLQRLADEMDRREQVAARLAAQQDPPPSPAAADEVEDWLAGPDGDTAGRPYDWPDPDDLTPEQLRLDELVESGRDYLDAYAEVYGLDPAELGRQAAASAVHRRAGETLDQAVRRAYDEWLHHEYLSAEEWTRGHMLSPAGRAAGIDPRTLFSGQVSRARRYASEDLLRFWSEGGHQRMNVQQFRAHTLGRERDIRAAQQTEFLSQGEDFI